MNTENRLRTSAEDPLEELISRWSAKPLPRGEKQGRVKDDGQAVEDAPRGLILGARLLWTYSAAYRVTGKKAYLASAEMLYHYLKEAFFDKECGGAFFEITHDGKPLRDYKHVYAEAFVIYALSEFYRASGREEALSDAYQFFDFIEKAHDDTFGGYFEVLHRDGTHAKEILGTNQ
ncbi:MAG: AGE family epimerase/isomerase, partial [Clostridia bacterium]|nr:AGE family epimerase/isomerase [Clostridia bacterium]